MTIDTDSYNYIEFNAFIYDILSILHQWLKIVNVRLNLDF